MDSLDGHAGTLEVLRRNLHLNYSLVSFVQKDGEPTSFREALLLPHWKEAIQIELDSIEKNDTWTLVPRPPRRKVGL